MTNGLLYIVADDAPITGMADLAGHRVAVPFRGDTPELIFSQLLEHAGVAQDDLQITYTGSPTEAMQLMLAGRVEAALTTEPSTSAAILKARANGRDLRRAISVQDAWGQMTNASPILPQAGLAVTDTLLETGFDLSAFQDVIAEVTQDVLANPEAAAANATEALGTPAPLLAASIPHSNLVATPATEARGDIERMLLAMAGEDMSRIGGSLPDDGFYL